MASSPGMCMECAPRHLPRSAEMLKVLVDGRCGGESACKRDSVVTCVTGSHPSDAVYPRVPLLTQRRAGNSCPLLDLAPEGVCRAVRVTPHAGALLPHRFTLTCGGRDRSRPLIGGLSLLHVRQVAPTWLSPASCPVESRLSSTYRKTGVPRPPDRLTIAPSTLRACKA